MQRPNLLVVMTDQQRADSVGWAGAGSVDTPSLDTLARRGVAFENAYSASTTCVPARSSLLTGVLDNRLPRAADGRALREGHWTIAHALRAAGYQTALLGKMHFCPIQAQHGFEVVRSCEHLTASAGYGPDDTDDYRGWLTSIGLEDVRGQRHGPAFPYPASHHPTGWITEQAIQFLRARDPSRPFFMIVSYTSPHSPLDPAEPYASMYDPTLQVLPNEGVEMNENLPGAFAAALREPIGSMFRPQYARDRPLRALGGMLAATRALIRHIDDSVAELMEHVSLADTVMFFTSDHGDYGGHRGLLGKVPWIPFDDLAKVPFFCAGMGIEGGRRVRAPVQSADIALTCLDLAQVRHPAPFFDTKSLLPLLRGGPEDANRSVFSAFSMGWPMIRKGALKCIWHHSGDIVLFDVQADPGERQNLAGNASMSAALQSLSIELQLMRKRPPLDLWVSRPAGI